ncbi:MAG: sigma-70 family RNA polymerase sigma factor, partial [Planctomycetota bacterium]
RIMHDPSTAHSLIDRLAANDGQSNRYSDDVESDWVRFIDLYRPLIYRVARARGLQHADAEDMAQDVLAIVRRRIVDFDTTAKGSFRGWLAIVTRNLCVNHLTRSRGPVGSGDSAVLQMLNQVPQDNETATLFRLGLRRQLLRNAAAAVKQDFATDTWNAFWWTAVDQQSIGDVAKRLGKSPGTIRVARCRVMARIQQYVRDNDLDLDR